MRVYHVRWIITLCLIFFVWRGDPWAIKTFITLGVIAVELITWEGIKRRRRDDYYSKR